MASKRPISGLEGREILLVEDEYFLADEVRAALADAGATVVGPFGNMADALAALDRHENLSSAVLDINVRDTPVFPIAEALRRRGIPFIFATGYDQTAIPAPYQDVARCEKPTDTAEIVRLLAAV